MKITILDDYQQAIQGLQCFELLKGHEVQLVHDYVPAASALAQRIKDTEALVLTRTRTPVGEQLLAQLPHLKIISQTGKNAGHIDVEACTRRGIAIAEGRGNPIATAELTWMLIMNALRQLPQAIEGMKSGGWQTNIGRRVAGKRIGIWGYGKIGKRIAHYASAFATEVMIWGSETSRNAAQKEGYSTAPDKATFFSTCDVVTLHLRLRPATRGIVKKADLLRMKSDAVFVNTARAALLEPGALLAALHAGRPGFAAIDVHDQEPIFDTQHPLLQLTNVIATPHLGYVEGESYELYFGQAFENILAFANGKPQNIANPAVL